MCLQAEQGVCVGLGLGQAPLYVLGRGKQPRATQLEDLARLESQLCH